MLHFNYLRIFIMLYISILINGCGAKSYSFDIDAPPKYKTDDVFKTMKVERFKSNKPAYQNSLTTMIKTGIAKEGYIKIINYSADSTLKGTIDISPIKTDMENNSYECEKKINGKKVKTTCHSYKYKKQEEISINYSLINNKNQSVVFGESLTEKFDDSWTSYKSRSEARSKAKSDTSIINELLKKLSKKIVKAVTPHKETIRRELQDGDGDDNIELGITYVENGRLEQAISIWGQAISQAKSNKSIAAGYYNIGVIKESQGSYQDAFDLYSKANNILPQEVLYIKAMTRTEKLNKQHTKVRQWKQ